MQRCLDLALNGIPDVFPNPAVGCVIVAEDRIIGEGFHRRFGADHAEIEAINSVENKKLLQQSTLYVNLEPCSHYGKTPPCALRIVKEKIPRVVIATIDPSSRVNGKGIKILKESGIEVTTGILEKEAILLNKRFFTYHLKKRPYIILKWAQTSNGFISGQEKDPVIISSIMSRTLVHRMRATESAILIGKTTALTDNPGLTTRLWNGKNPVRVLIDRYLAVPEHFNIFNPDAKTWIFNELVSKSADNKEWIKVDFSKQVIPTILKILHDKDIQSLIVEGGAFTLNSFLQQNLWDEIHVFISPKTFKQGTPAPLLNRKADWVGSSGEDLYKIFFNTDL